MSTKKCIKCLEHKDIDEFSIYRMSKKTGLPLIRTICKECFHARNLKIQRRHTSNNREKIKENAINYYNKLKSNPEWVEHRKKMAREARLNNYSRTLYSSSKSRAKKEGLDFNLEMCDIIIPETCPILNIPITIGNTKLKADSPTIDRVDNSIGYVKGNIQVISCLANRMKADATYEQMIVFTKNILNYMKPIT